MPTAVVDRPRSHVIDGSAADRSVTDRTVSVPPSTMPAPRSATVRSSRPAVTDPRTPACVGAAEVFHHPLLECEPVASAPARVRRQYAMLAAEAGKVCAACPLLSNCLYRAVVECDVAGFAAGTTPRQRSKIRARLGIEVESEDFDHLAGVAGGQRTVDHDELVRLRRANPHESLERIAQRLGCSLSTVKRHLSKERSEPSPVTPVKQRPTQAQVRRATAETLAENSGNRRAAA